MTPFAVRLLPGQDLKQELTALVQRENIAAGAVLTCVGSLSHVCLRFAGRSEASHFSGDYEIVSLVGTLSPDGLHLHTCVSDANGAVLGGHVLDGCIVRTTAEIVIVALPGMTFHRVLDPTTGYNELVIATAP